MSFALFFRNEKHKQYNTYDDKIIKALICRLLIEEVSVKDTFLGFFMRNGGLKF